MNRDARLLALGVLLVGMGCSIFYSSNDLWGFRGVVYAAVGVVLIYLKAKKISKDRYDEGYQDAIDFVATGEKSDAETR